MPFDGISYRSARRIAPHEYHPGAPVSGGALATALRGAYSYSRNRSRLVATQTYPVLQADPARARRVNLGVTGDARVADSWTTVWNVNRYAPTHYTHFVIRALCQVALFGSTVIYARATRDNTDGSQVEVSVDGGEYGSIRYSNGEVRPHKPIDSDYQIVVHDRMFSDVFEFICEVGMDKPDDVANVTLSMKSDQSSAALQPLLRMLSLTAWMEARG